MITVLLYKGVRYLPHTEVEQRWALPFLPVQVGLDGEERLEGEVERMLHVLFDHLQQVLSELSSTERADSATPGELALELQHSAVQILALTLLTTNLGLVRGRGSWRGEVGAGLRRR